MTQKKWTIADTVAFIEVILDNKGMLPTKAQYKSLVAQTGCTQASAEWMAWRMQTALGYPVTPARGITSLDRAVIDLYRARDPRMPE